MARIGFRKSFTKLGLALWICVGFASQVWAQNPAFGELGQYLPRTGQQGAWRYQYGANGFEIENVADPGAIQYFYVAPDQGSEGRRRIETQVSIHPESSGSAGLLYGLNQSRSIYHMVTLDAGGTVRLFRRDDSGFRAMLETQSSAFQPGKVNTLVIEENGDEISYFLNGTSLGSIGGSLFGSGAVGLGAVGDARAFFTAFSAKAMQRGKGADRQKAPWSPGRSETPAAAQRSDTVQVRPIQIYDEQGPAGRMLAYSTFVPEGWITKGGVQWSQQDGPAGCFTGARLIWGTGTEDEKYGIAFLDPVSWGVSTIGPSRYMCLQQDLTDAEMVMRAFFQMVSQVMQVTNIEVSRPPEIKPITDAIGQAWQRSWQMNGTPTNAWADGVVIKARVRSQTAENDAYFVAFTKHSESNLGGAIFRDGRTVMIIGAFTPVGKLEEGHPGFAQVLNNLRVNPQWQQVEAQWMAARVQTARNANAAAARARRASSASSSSSGSIGDMMFESWKKRQGMKDAGHEKDINGIWEVQPWQTSSGDTVLLNQNYDHAWELDNGSIVMTNDANFSPMDAFNQTGQQLQLGN